MLSYLNKYWNKIIDSYVVSFSYSEMLHLNDIFHPLQHEWWWIQICQMNSHPGVFATSHHWIRPLRQNRNGLANTLVHGCDLRAFVYSGGLLVMTDWWAGFLNSTDWVITSKCSEQGPNWPQTSKLWESLAQESIMADSPLWSCDQGDECSIKHLVISEMARMCSHVLWVCGLPRLLLQLLLDSSVSYLTSTEHTHALGQLEH